jgi:hypothetical protein
MEFYQKHKVPGEKQALLCGLPPLIFDEALGTGSLGTLLVVTYQLFITITFKKKKVETPY